MALLPRDFARILEGAAAFVVAVLIAVSIAKLSVVIWKSRRVRSQDERFRRTTKPLGWAPKSNLRFPDSVAVSSPTPMRMTVPSMLAACNGSDADIAKACGIERSSTRRDT